MMGAQQKKRQERIGSVMAGQLELYTVFIFNSYSNRYG
jgi:hypothetical protein